MVVNKAIVWLFTFLIVVKFSAELVRGSEIESVDCVSKNNELRTYIIHVKKPEAQILSQANDFSRYHKSFLRSPANQGQDLLYSYKHVINGFAARLTEQDVEAMKEMDGFLAAHPEKMLHRQTTHTPRFLGLHQETGLWRESNLGKGVIIGVLDGGILPTHPSFSDEGMPPPPVRWKGKCEFVTSKCNNKIIGARTFNNSATIVSVLDEDGHGSHVAGIAAGRFVKNAGVLGLGKGTAAGIAPKAHLAIYKVCPNTDTCFESDLLAGIDAAVNDGVDIISISIVGKFSVPFFEDAIAVGSFAAIQKGIFVSCSAGNTGPLNGTVLNDAPWILTVGASTIDRSFKVIAELDNGEVFDGESLFQPENFTSAFIPLTYAGSSSNANSSFCADGSLEGLDVKGKIVLCERGVVARVSKGDAVKKAGGAAMILMNQEIDGSTTIAENHVLPAAHISYDTGASTIDRSFKVIAELDNGEVFDGESLFQPENFTSAFIPLTYAGSSSNANSSFCADGSLEGLDVKGKIVLCERGVVARVSKGDAVKKAGGAAMILMNQEIDGSTTIAENHVLPAAHISYDTGLKIKAFINSTAEPKASISFNGTAIGNMMAPAVASFSSRGPSKTTPGILKPDIIGPGVNILSAWPFSVDGNTNSESPFNVESGTSMSCPHLSGVAALLKSAHPNWSPAAIKSAIMTTADSLNLQNKPIVDENSMLADIFATGAGHVNPSKANDPGLVYDIHPDDYIPYLCGLGYTDNQVRIITQQPINCTNGSSISEAQLNYPSFSIILGPKDQTYTRTMTNVGEANTTYNIEILAPEGVLVTVKPERVHFTQTNQQLTYLVTFSRSSETVNNLFVQGHLKWISTDHIVSSLIVVKLL